MSIYTTTLRLNHRDAITGNAVAHRNTSLLRLVVNAIFAGFTSSKSLRYELKLNGAGGSRAAQQLALSGGAGAVGAVIGGVSITATWAGTDAASMTLVVAAINASVDALVQYQVEASNTAADITVASVAAGESVQIGQWKFTGQTGTPTEWGFFSVDTDDIATALSLAAAINAHPDCSRIWGAVANTDVVNVYRYATPTEGGTVVRSDFATITTTAEAASNIALVRSISRTALANHITFAATGTGVTASGSRLVLGAGDNVAQVAGRA